jgi:hypothetical protein
MSSHHNPKLSTIILPLRALQYKLTMMPIKSFRPAVAMMALLSTLLLTVCQSSVLGRRHPIAGSSTVDTGRTLELVNKSGRKLVVDWVDPKTGQARTLHSGIGDGQSTIFNSFVNHTFAIHEPSENCNGPSGKTCAVRYIPVNDKDQQGRPPLLSEIGSSERKSNGFGRASLSVKAHTQRLQSSV